MNDQTTTITPLNDEAPNADMKEDAFALEAALITLDLIREKLIDAQTPGYQAEFDPIEAEAAGAFPEDALSEADALASTHDYLHFVQLTSSLKP